MGNQNTNFKITPREARCFLIHYQGLSGEDTFVGERGILEYIQRVGCIQYDPLNVVGRNPDLVLQSRIRGYRPAMLERMLYTDRSLLDGWDKMMAIYLREDWPFFQRLRKEKEKEVIQSLNYRRSLEALDFADEVRKNLTGRGPLQSTQIDLGRAGKGRWGHRNLSGATMDYMFNTGELGIFKKKNTQKIYDRIENLLPRELLDAADPFANDHDFVKWYIKRRIGGMGFLWGRNGGGWLGQFLADKGLRLAILSELVEEKSLVTLSIEGMDEIFYMRKEDRGILEGMNQSEKRMRFLAPLDNLLWDRDLVEKLFNFKYSWEVYLPPGKRKYGYYVLPVLYGDRLIARFEPEKHQGKNPLRIKNWWWEKGITETKEIKSALKGCSASFSAYLEGERDESG